MLHVESVYQHLEIVTRLEYLAVIPRPWHVLIEDRFHSFLPILTIFKNWCLSHRRWRSENTFELLIESYLSPGQLLSALLDQIFVHADSDIFFQLPDHLLIASNFLQIFD